MHAAGLRQRHTAQSEAQKRLTIHPRSVGHANADPSCGRFRRKHIGSPPEGRDERSTIG
jgi:ribosomal protein L32